MKYNQTKLALNVFFSLFIAISAHAQQKEKTKLAHVELLFFKPSESDEAALYRLSEMSSTRQAEVPALNLFSTATQTFGQTVRLSSNYVLTEEYDKLKRSSSFDVLYHIAWLQPRYDLGQATVIKLLSHRTGNFISATAQLAYNNLYKLKLNIFYDTSTDTGEIDIPITQSLLVNFEKVMTDEKTYHLDHILFGVLAKIIEIDPASIEVEPIISDEGSSSGTNTSTISDPQLEVEDLIKPTAE